MKSLGGQSFWRIPQLGARLYISELVIFYYTLWKYGQSRASRHHHLGSARGESEIIKIEKGRK